METKLIKGLIAPILTPFDNDLKLDQTMYNDLAKSLIENGCSGLGSIWNNWRSAFSWE